MKKGANLSYCCLERADLSSSNIEGATLFGCKMVCANLENCNLRGKSSLSHQSILLMSLILGTNMEEPHGNRTNMEGVNLKGANLEGSQMAGVNLRYVRFCLQTNQLTLNRICVVCVKGRHSEERQFAKL